MAVLDRSTFMERVQKVVGNDTSDEMISFMEDMTDTYDSFSGGEDWKAKYEENDRSWREKYMARFKDGGGATSTTGQPNVPPDQVESGQDAEVITGEDITYSDIFSEGGK